MTCIRGKGQKKSENDLPASFSSSNDKVLYFGVEYYESHHPVFRRLND
jgi:hypothetical protein